MGPSGTYVPLYKSLRRQDCSSIERWVWLPGRDKMDASSRRPGPSHPSVCTHLCQDLCSGLHIQVSTPALPPSWSSLTLLLSLVPSVLILTPSGGGREREREIPLPVCHHCSPSYRQDLDTCPVGKDWSSGGPVVERGSGSAE